MANAIRYSTTGDTQSLKSGNFYFGVGDVGKGPSSATTYYNGSTPVASGYTVYSFDSTQTSRISYVSPTSDSEFISITNAKSGQNFTGVTQCLNWYVTQNDHVAVNEDYEGIVTNGLTVNVDAGFTPSYTSSGTTWYDLSYNGYNPTLINGTSYDNTNGGVMVFDGVNDYVGFSSGYTQLNFTGSTPYTLELFVRIDEVTEGSYERLVDKEGTEMGGGRDGYNILVTKIGPTSGSTRIQGERWVGGLNYGGFLLDKLDNTFIGVWNHFVWSYSGGSNNSKLYNNGYLVDQRNAGGSLTNILKGLRLMGPSSPLKGNVSSFRVYNRPLSSSEVLQNYQAQFPRFLGENIITNNLAFYVDAGYRPSYPTSGTTWYDVSGYAKNGTLVNGPTYNSSYGGSLYLDGTDDQINTDFQFSGIGNSTIYIWCNFSSTTTNDMILQQGSSVGRIWLYKSSTDNIGLNTYWGGSYDYYLGTTRNIANKTGLVTITINKTGNQSVYYNGQLLGSMNISDASSVPYQNATLSLSSRLTPPNWYRPVGNIFNVICYNSLHSSSDITQNYKSQFPRFLGENIVTNGLQLYLDSGYKSSYPTAGTTWFNVSGVDSASGNTATLFNGVSYSGSNNGTLIFDGVDDFVDFNAPNLGTTTTVEMWCKIGSGYSGKMFFGWLFYDVFCGGGNIGYNTAASDIYGISSSVVSSLGLVNNWKHYVFEMRSDVSYTNNKIYVNGLSQELSQRAGSEASYNRSFNSGNGRIATWRVGTGYNMPMECAIFKVYNRALTQNEINQNFNATKSRFGL
jgi:hypothetical protein